MTEITELFHLADLELPPMPWKRGEHGVLAGDGKPLWYPDRPVAQREGLSRMLELIPGLFVAAQGLARSVEHRMEPDPALQDGGSFWGRRLVQADVMVHGEYRYDAATMALWVKGESEAFAHATDPSAARRKVEVHMAEQAAKRQLEGIPELLASFRKKLLQVPGDLSEALELLHIGTDAAWKKSVEVLCRQNQDLKVRLESLAATVGTNSELCIDAGIKAHACETKLAAADKNRLEGDLLIAADLDRLRDRVFELEGEGASDE